MQGSRVGIFAGSFDPIHNGHLAFAEAAVKLCNLDKVVFVPEPKPRGKHGVTDVMERLAMLRAATQGNAMFDVLGLADDTFTVAKTLPELQQHFKGAQLVMLFGSDVAASLHTWPGVKELLAQTELAVGFREGAAPLTQVTATIIPTDHAHVAASHIRRGDSDEIPTSVRDYIKKHGLYRV